MAMYYQLPSDRQEALQGTTDLGVEVGIGDLEPEEDAIEHGRARELERRVVGLLDATAGKSVVHRSQVEVAVRCGRVRG